MSEWKAIADEMPPDGVPVLCFGYRWKDSLMCTASYYAKHKYWDPCGDHGQACDFDIEPTHWMPLPASPDSAGDGHGNV